MAKTKTTPKEKRLRCRKCTFRTSREEEYLRHKRRYHTSPTGTRQPIDMINHAPAATHKPDSTSSPCNSKDSDRGKPTQTQHTVVMPIPTTPGRWMGSSEPSPSSFSSSSSGSIELQLHPSAEDIRAIHPTPSTSTRAKPAIKIRQGAGKGPECYGQRIPTPKPKQQQHQETQTSTAPRQHQETQTPTAPGKQHQETQTSTSTAPAQRDTMHRETQTIQQTLPRRRSPTEEALIAALYALLNAQQTG